MTATSISAISMAPPSMLMCVNQSAALHHALNYAQEFAIKILSRAHISIFRLRSGGREWRKPVRHRVPRYRAVAPGLVDAQAAIICRKSKRDAYRLHGSSHT